MRSYDGLSMISFGAIGPSDPSTVYLVYVFQSGILHELLLFPIEDGAQRYSNMLSFKPVDNTE